MAAGLPRTFDNVDRREISPGQGRPKRGARPGITAAEDRIGIVAHRVEPANRLPSFIEGPCAPVDADPATCPDIARIQFHCIKRRLPDRRETWIGSLVRVSHEAVVGGIAFAEFHIPVVCAVGIVPRDGGLQPVRIDAHPASKFRHRSCDQQIAVTDQLPARKRPWPCQPHAITPHRAGIADQKRQWWLKPVHGAYKVVIGISLVHETAAVPVDRNEPRLGAIADQMRECRDRAVDLVML